MSKPPFFIHLQQYYDQHPELIRRLQKYQSLQSNSSAPDRKIIFHSLLNKLLETWNIPFNSRSPYRELLPLYQLTESLNPHYFRSDQILKELRQCTTLSEDQRQQLLDPITLFLQILKQTNLQPEQVIAEETLELWYKMFPAGHQWKALQLLEEQGLCVPSSQKGFQAWSRFTQGQLLPENHSPLQWEHLCRENGEHQNEMFFLNLQASAFAGELEFFDIPGFCGEFPDCPSCPLHSECQWNQKSTGTDEENSPSMATSIQKLQFENLDEVELLGVVLSLSVEEKDKLKKSFSQENPLRILDRKNLRELEQLLPGTPKTVEKIKIILELCKRYNEEKLTPGTAFRSSTGIFQHFRYQLRDLKQEMFIIVLLDNKHQYLTDQMITKGILNKSLVHPREVFANAIEHRAAAIICVHNHPSGDPKASPEDIQITKRLIEAGKVVGIPVLDHVIIGNDRYMSLADEGLL